MSSYPKISIVTPSYNQAKFLEETILSVINQNYPNLEYIIIDGGSKDGSIEIIKKYEKYLAYWVSEPDKGQSHALNKGFKKCTGDVVGWQNSDDIYMPGVFFKIAEVFQKTGVDVVFGNKFIISEKGEMIHEMRYVPFSLLTHIYEGMSIANQSTFWKRSLFEKCGYIDESLHLAMDYDFFLRLKLKNAKFYHIREPLGALRLHSISKTMDVENRDKWEEEIRNILEANGVNLNRRIFKKFISILRRTVLYIFQGDINYIVNGFLKRLRYNSK